MIDLLTVLSDLVSHLQYPMRAGPAPIRARNTQAWASGSSMLSTCDMSLRRRPPDNKEGNVIMSLKTLMVAAATALALSTSVQIPTSHARSAEDRAERQDLMSRKEARHALYKYFKAKGRQVRISRTWVEGNYYFAKVKSWNAITLGTYSVDLRSGRVKRIKKG